MEEARAIYQYAEILKERAIAHSSPPSNHLGDNFVESRESEAHAMGLSSTATSLDPTKLFMNLEGSNVAFKRWHPMSVTHNGGRLAGHGDMGGLWEWTSSTLEKQDGYEPMKLYPSYSGIVPPRAPLL